MDAPGVLLGISPAPHSARGGLTGGKHKIRDRTQKLYPARMATAVRGEPVEP
jgi:hypothetical protein